MADLEKVDVSDVPRREDLPQLLPLRVAGQKRLEAPPTLREPDPEHDRVPVAVLPGHGLTRPHDASKKPAAGQRVAVDELNRPMPAEALDCGRELRRHEARNPLRQIDVAYRHDSLKVIEPADMVLVEMREDHGI